MDMVECTVEEIIYENKDNGYTVCAVYDDEAHEFVAVGCMPYTNMGDKLRLYGSWTIHLEYGEQFKVAYYERAPLEEERDILIYLSSGAIKGIKEKLAKKIVDTFGSETLNVIRESPGRLTSIKGISEDKASEIHNIFLKQESMQQIVVFFSKYEVNATFAYKVYNELGDNAILEIKNNPYILCRKVEGVGFRTADKIAFSMGYDAYSPQRIESGVLHILSEAAGSGHTYLPREMIIERVQESLEVESEAIQNAIIKLIMDEGIRLRKLGEIDALYLPAFYVAEQGVAYQLINLHNKEIDLNETSLDVDIKEIEQASNICLTERQREAIYASVASGVMVITGGPGTGKTTIINSIIKLMEKHKIDVALCAPTGRAAKRMTELTGRDAKTIHRLLKMEFSKEKNKWDFAKNEKNPLKEDVIIVDEASMVDILLMNNLLKAIKEDGRLIIVGDADQLPSVGAGNVLKDIIKSDTVKVITLKEIFRQAEESMIVVNAHKINAGEYPIFKTGKESDFFFIDRPVYSGGIDEIIELVTHRLPKFLNQDPLYASQVITPVRKGEMGVYNLNKRLQDVFNPVSANKKEIRRKNYILREGDKIMQIKNNYDIEWKSKEIEGSGLFNGDIGFIERIKENEGVLNIVFDGDRLTQYPYELLDDIELAYAMTVHKSQGSEFPAVIMPIYPVNQMLLCRNLFYTAVTRAKQLVVLVGRREIVEYMTDNNYQANRCSGLRELMESFV